eukprot:TRINITY_DN14055_c0_g1_i1.p1 TRINITY_DN14055_c0_g1~~TRINITY_DN14055_c0_g1_i1.p1  ORF type:complete len:229 (+),score=22.54 TRINITY_DN14055_c0_g1_i1:64-750(+)
MGGVESSMDLFMCMAAADFVGAGADMAMGGYRRPVEKSLSKGDFRRAVHQSCQHVALSPREKDLLVDLIFALFDLNEDGSVTASEVIQLKRMVDVHGPDPLVARLKELERKRHPAIVALGGMSRTVPSARPAGSGREPVREHGSSSRRQPASSADAKTEHIMGLFTRYDSDKSGKIDFKEFLEIARRVAPDANYDKCKKLFRRADVDGSGLIDPNEFINWIFKDFKAF